MDARSDNPVLIVGSENELPLAQRVWGTGGWLQPEDREALDWLTLTRLLGWGTSITRLPDPLVDEHPRLRWIILACSPDDLSEQFTAQLGALLAVEPILVIARASDRSSHLARLAGVHREQEVVRGREFAWHGPGLRRSWSCRHEFESNVLSVSEDASIWANLEGTPLIVARKVGRGTIATIAFHPSSGRDVDGAVTSLLRQLLVFGVEAPVCWLDFEHTLVLRMDDPGGAQNVYSRDWYYPKLGERQWQAIGADLEKRHARLSIGYVSGWVDDGDTARGELRIGGQPCDRIPGKIYPSPLVKYRDLAGHAPDTVHDYEAEYRGITRLRVAGLADVEIHGFTHMHPNHEAWVEADDRYYATKWYREFGPGAHEAIAARPAGQHPLTLGLAALRRHFNVEPTTLICPGDQWTNETLEHALDLGLRLISSYYLAVRDEERFCWANHVCAPYLDSPDAAWFDSGLPVVGYFHDREVALEGVEWIINWLDRWQEAGANRMIDLRELATALSCRLFLEERNGISRLTIDNDLQLVRPLPIFVRLPKGRVARQLSLLMNGKDITLELDSSDGVSRGLVPVMV